MYNIVHHAGAPGMRDTRRRPALPAPAGTPALRIVSASAAPEPERMGDRGRPRPRGVPEASPSAPGG